jgi:serine kinase of HPr protein (carbohydrate metabolism regulator)
VNSQTTNLHATVLVLSGKGVIILGASGAGKTSLALELIREASRDKIDARLVADDRVDVSLADGQLRASPPANLAGLVEVRGSGVHDIGYATSALLELAVQLVEPKASERISPAEPEQVALGITLPVLRLPIGDTGPQVRAVLAHLGLYVPLKR